LGSTVTIAELIEASAYPAEVWYRLGSIPLSAPPSLRNHMLLCLSEPNKFLSAFGPTPHTKADENGRKDTKIHEKDTPVNSRGKRA